MRFRHIATLSVLSFTLARAAAAATLAEEIDEIHRLDGQLAAHGDPALAGRAARLKEAAIAHAIVEYRIDIKGVASGVHYSPHGNMRERDGVTLVDGDGTVRVQVGDAGFRSAGCLGSTIAHEVEVHVDRQIAKGVRDPAGDEQGVAMHEIEAYDHELASQARFGLDEDELRLVRQRRAAFYRTLQYENRRRVDEGNYVKW